MLTQGEMALRVASKGIEPETLGESEQTSKSKAKTPGNLLGLKIFDLPNRKGQKIKKGKTGEQK